MNTAQRPFHLDHDRFQSLRNKSLLEFRKTACHLLIHLARTDP